MTITMEELIELNQLQERLKKIKKAELALRNKVIKYFRYDKSEGTVHKDFEGADVVIGLKLSRSIDADALDTNWTDLSEEERDCIIKKPSLDTKAYKLLVESGEAKELMNCVTEKPAQASVKIEFAE